MRLVAKQAADFSEQSLGPLRQLGQFAIIQEDAAAARADIHGHAFQRLLMQIMTTLWTMHVVQLLQPLLLLGLLQVKVLYILLLELVLIFFCNYLLLRPD